MHIRQVNFHYRYFYRGDRIAQRITVVGVCARVEYDAICPLIGIVDGVHQRTFGVRLEVTQLDLPFGRPTYSGWGRLKGEFCNPYDALTLGGNLNVSVL
jgi:hypothetical protein